MIEIPWLLGPSELRTTLKTAGANEALAAMYALGADAFALNWRLEQLQASPDNALRGLTGTLHMDEQGRIHRQLTAATFRNGEPRPRE